ncbi:MBT domain-containing protein 1-like, partial [Nothobranchius furzeri]
PLISGNRDLSQAVPKQKKKTPQYKGQKKKFLLRMKEEPAEVDEFTFSQGTSDQESNSSGSYYVKQEH